MYISQLDIESDAKGRRDSPLLKNHLNSLFKGVTEQLYQNSTNPLQASLDLTIRTTAEEINPTLYSLMIPYGVACSSTLVLVCLISGEEIVVVEGLFKNGEKEKVTLSGAGAGAGAGAGVGVGAGASRLVARSPYAGDGNQ